MIKYKNITLKEVFDLSHWIRQMSISDKRNLLLSDTTYSIEHNTWSNLFEVNRNDEAIGFIEIYKALEHRRVDVNTIYILSKYRQQHHAAHAMLCICYYVFEYLCYRKIESLVFAYNEAGCEFQKKYMRLEGTRKKSWYHRGKYYDGLYFGMFKKDFNKLVQKLGINLDDISIK